nr:hypothetical protein [Tanacetum cinerariifolium]
MMLAKKCITWCILVQIAMDKDSSTIREILSLVKIYMLLFREQEAVLRKRSGVRKLKVRDLERQDSRTSLFQEEENDAEHVRVSTPLA